MNIVLVVCKAFFVPLILNIILLVMRFKIWKNWLIFGSFSFFWSVLMLMYTDWSLISQYLRIAMMCFLPIAILVTFWRHRGISWEYKKRPPFLSFLRWLLIIPGILLVVVTVLRVTTVFFDSQSNREAVQIKFPLRGGIYSISHGGNSSALNYHYEYPSQKYAIDIVKLNIWGISKRNFLMSRNLDDYVIYSEPVYSPVYGKVVKVVDGMSDAFKTGPLSTRSNMVVIEYKDFYILLLHLKKGSIQIKEGDLVEAGQKIGKVGNSGYSTEPHLHIHAIKKTEGKNEEFRGPSVPLVVDGTQLKRNDLILNERILFR